MDLKILRSAGLEYYKFKAAAKRKNHCHGFVWEKLNNSGIPGREADRMNRLVV